FQNPQKIIPALELKLGSTFFAGHVGITPSIPHLSKKDLSSDCQASIVLSKSGILRTRRPSSRKTRLLSSNIRSTVILSRCSMQCDEYTICIERSNGGRTVVGVSRKAWGLRGPSTASKLRQPE